ncbi:LacI family DNA-binding transcriptional regulator [Lentzea jiangxiensis]|uniref:DNA-binding transcriptional regulator, LacI/PurR family n=1 Tax=Lentzea jiangxiensis TaxID=641025 RepID=A0A1H0L2I6_9PSEU|nr:LacI family DNA-binding transcriptional regulator [Lentzea jiangxiensis]SDO62181.1 DNA-binding transcriptional regulator, LacI/PurR family [Lentzea jiangxiensis]
MSKVAPTLEDVARVAGVSRATVSRVVNGTRNVDPGIQETVRNAIEQTGYTPNRAARSLVTRRTGTVALVISGAGGGSDVFTDPFFGRVTAGVVDFLRGHSVHPVLMLADSDPARTEVVEFLRQGSADGALLVSTHPVDPLPARLLDAGVPSVLYARPGRPMPVSYVDMDHRAGGRMAADHLVAAGRYNTTTISGPLDVLASQDRHAGFRDAMARHGFPYVPSAEGGFTFESGATAMQRLLTECPDLDAVFAANDLMAQAAVDVLQAHGLRIPDDVAVIGFDDSAPALACRPQLTTIRQPVERMAAEMAALLLADLEKPGQRPRSVIFEPELVVRASA